MSQKYYCCGCVKRYSKNGGIINYGKYLNRSYHNYSKNTIVPSESYKNVVFKSCNGSYIK